MIREKSCGAVVYTLEHDQEPHYLLIRHVNGGHWAFAKGHVENNETEAETALREINEETGLQVTLDTTFRVTTEYSPKPDVVKEVVYFVAQAADTTTTRQEVEVTDIAWLPYESARQQLTYPADQAILDQAHHYLQANQ